MVECDLPKVEIAGSSPVSRSMLTKGMFWKKFYFVVILLSCNCFLLCSNGFCKLVKEVFGCGQSETTTTSDNVPSDNLNNKNNNIDNNNIGNEGVDNNSNNDPVGDTLAYDVQNDKTRSTLVDLTYSKKKPLSCVYF